MDFIKYEVEGKTPDEVEAYAKVFWERYKEIAGMNVRRKNINF